MARKPRKGFDEWETIGVGIRNFGSVMRWTGTKEQFEETKAHLLSMGWKQEGNTFSPPDELAQDRYLESIFGPRGKDS